MDSETYVGDDRRFLDPSGRARATFSSANRSSISTKDHRACRVPSTGQAGYGIDCRITASERHSSHGGMKCPSSGIKTSRGESILLVRRIASKQPPHMAQEAAEHFGCEGMFVQMALEHISGCDSARSSRIVPGHSRPAAVPCAGR